MRTDHYTGRNFECINKDAKLLPGWAKEFEIGQTYPEVKDSLNRDSRFLLLDSPEWGYYIYIDRSMFKEVTIKELA